jgi:protein subunit release factor B
MPLDFEVYDESETPDHVRGGGGGGHHKSVSRETASRELIATLQKERRAAAEAKITQYIAEHWKNQEDPKTKAYLEKFVKWMKYASRQKDLVLDPNEVSMKFQTSSGPGGQNRNKVATAVIAVHNPTQEQVFEDEFRTQIENRTGAMKLLTGNVKDLLATWKETSIEFRQEAGKTKEVSA